MAGTVDVEIHVSETVDFVEFARALGLEAEFVDVHAPNHVRLAAKSGDIASVDVFVCLHSWLESGGDDLAVSKDGWTYRMSSDDRHAGA